MSNEQLWRKSTRSNSGTSCVELNGDLSAVRDSKNSTGPIMLVAGLAQFLNDIKSGRFDR